LHIHDEASLRLRSKGDLAGAPSRSRSSKVMQHIVEARFPGQPGHRWLCELHPLGDKMASTIATSLRQVLQAVVGAVADGFGAQRPASAPWLMHILVGDGVASNEAAARVLLAWVRRDGLPQGLRYFVVVVKCASHQANLVIGSSVAGRAALVAAQQSASLGDAPWAQRPLAAQRLMAADPCGAIVRFYKFLVSDYYGEFLKNLQDIVGSMRACFRSPQREDQRARWERLHQLYGESALPRQLLDFLNCGLDAWEHCVPDGVAPEWAERRCEEVRDGALELLRRRLLVVDEHPTPTRMFTFSVHVEGFLLMDFLHIGPSLVKLRGTGHRPRGRKRVEKVVAFLTAAGTPSYLRRTSLALQMVQHIASICAQLGKPDEPLLVRLAKGVAERAMSDDFGRLLGLVHLDPQLDVGATIALLLATGAELAMRFRPYSAWPFAAWRLCARFNPDGYLAAQLDFLAMPDKELDVGFGLPLRRLAEASGNSEVMQCAWLLSAPVQEAIALAFESGGASSLPVERAFAETKRSEAPRLCHVATAGRNQILRQFLRQRDEVLQRASHAEAVLKQSLRTNLQALAWQAAPEFAHDAKAGRNSGKAMRDFIARNRPAMEAELQRRRATARLAVERAKSHAFPVSEEDWVAWFKANYDQFYRRMDEASELRRADNRRLVSAADAPEPAKRLGAAPESRRRRDMPRLLQLLWGRTGWHLVEIAPNSLRLLFLVDLQRRTIAVDLSAHCQRGKVYALDSGVRLHSLVRPLEELGLPPDGRAFEVVMKGEAMPEQVLLTVARARPLTAPVSAPASRKRKAAPSASGSSESDSSGGGVIGHLPSSCESGASVATSCDSGVEDDLVAGRPEDSDAHVSDIESDRDVGGRARGPAQSSGFRHQPGTWTIWTSAWFYITKTPGYSDVKCWVKAGFRRTPGGMGSKGLSKTLTPAHYGDEWQDPWRTLLLLRAWALWRSKEWAAQRESRMHEFRRERGRLQQELEAVAAETPVGGSLLGSALAQGLLALWTPDLL
jgi:hypothetical protein